MYKNRKHNIVLLIKIWIRNANIVYLLLVCNRLKEMKRLFQEKTEDALVLFIDFRKNVKKWYVPIYCMFLSFPFQFIFIGLKIIPKREY